MLVVFYSHLLEQTLLKRGQLRLLNAAIFLGLKLQYFHLVLVPSNYMSST